MPSKDDENLTGLYCRVAVFKAEEGNLPIVKVMNRAPGMNNWWYCRVCYAGASQIWKVGQLKSLNSKLFTITPLDDFEQMLWEHNREKESARPELEFLEEEEEEER